MRVLLVGPDYESNLSLLYLAASLRAAGHEARIAAFNTGEDAPAVRAQARGCDLVGLSMSFQVRAIEFLDLAAALKRDAPQRPVIAGGHYASCAAAELLERHPALDLIVVHEGEQTLVELANLGEALLARAGEVHGVVVRREGKAAFTPLRPALADLDRLPRPDRSGPARLLCGVPTAYLMGSRGCVSRCDYCCITTLHRLAPGPRFRQRTPEDVADEMAGLFHEHGVRQFVFHDDNFLVPNLDHNRKRIGRIDAALKAREVRDIGLVLKCSPRDADPRILETLRGMGLLRIFMGIESGSQCGLDSIGRKQTVEQCERALAVCEALGISSQYTVIILNPEATVASMLADLDFVERHPGHPLNYCRAEIYAGTPLESRMLAAGRAQGNYLGRTYRYTDPAVTRVWDVGSDLFAGRCWGKDELLGRVIRMDHQVAVLSRFYEGRKARELARDFLEWERELNLETAGFFRELVLACGEASSTADARLSAAIDDLQVRERASREVRLRQACEFREALERFALASVRTGQRYALASGAGRRLRHAAAVAVAIGMLGCRSTPNRDEGVCEAAPPPLDMPVAGPPPPDAEVSGPAAGAPDAGPIAPYVEPRHDFGIAEAAPPPLPPARPAAGPDAGMPKPKPAPRHDHGVAEAAPPPLDIRPKDDERYRMDHGVAEAAPPPYDRYRMDHGVAEAAPPPLDPVPIPFVAMKVRTVPEVPIFVDGKKVPQPHQVSVQKREAMTLVSDSLTATLRVLPQSGGRVLLRIESNKKLLIRGNGPERGTPAQMPLDELARRHGLNLILVDPATQATLQVRLNLAP